MRKDDLKLMFKAKSHVAKHLIDIFFLTLTVRGPFHKEDFKLKKYGSTGLISEKWKLCMQNFKKSGSSHL